MNLKARLGIATVAGVVAVAVPAMVSMRGQAAASKAIPAATVAEAAQGGRDIAVLAGGCFWGVEAVYEHVRGVVDVRSGFAGGDAKSGNYSEVSGGRTGHAEAVRIVYDPRVVSYADLLRIFFAVAHDPTEVNRQGPDVGPQYRSAVFPQSPAQARTANAYIAQLNKAKAFNRPIATRVEKGKFYEAEAYHQDFMRRNPNHPYILIHDRPKLVALKRQFPASWKA